MVYVLSVCNSIVICLKVTPISFHEKCEISPVDMTSPDDEVITITHQVVGWSSCLTQCRTVTEVKHGRARSGVGWVTAQVIE